MNIYTYAYIESAGCGSSAPPYSRVHKYTHTRSLSHTRTHIYTHVRVHKFACIICIYVCIRITRSCIMHVSVRRKRGKNLKGTARAYLGSCVD